MWTSNGAQFDIFLCYMPIFIMLLLHFPPVVAGAGMSTSSMIKRIMLTSYTFNLPVTLSKFSSKTSHGNYQ